MGRFLLMVGDDCLGTVDSRARAVDAGLALAREQGTEVSVCYHQRAWLVEVARITADGQVLDADDSD